MLAQTKDFDTALALAENEGIRLTDSALVILADIAQEFEDVALPLLRRDGVTKELADFLYNFVGEELKQFITEHYSSEEQLLEIVASVDDVIVDFVEAGNETAKASEASTSSVDADSVGLPSDFVPQKHMMEAARGAQDNGLLNVPVMMEALRQNRIRSFVAQFSVYTAIPVVVLGQVLSQTNGKSLSIIAKAVGIEKQDFVSIFMMTSKVWNQGRLVEMDEIKTALEYYNKTTRDLAVRIVREKMQG